LFQVIAMWNLTRPDLEMKDSVENIKLRGYNSNPEDKVFITGQFALKIKNKELKSLSVSDIADRYCPTRRDLYYKKGINRPSRSRRSTWGGTAGRIVEKFLVDLVSKEISKKNEKTYQNLRKVIDKFSENFQNSNKGDLEKLSQLKEGDYENPEWLLQLLNSNGRAELGIKLLHSLIFNNGEVDLNHLKLNAASSLKLKPKPTGIGISSPVEPDFLIEENKVIGDIKSGTEFKPFHQLTCTGYALAYENEKKKDINWGIIYFFPTRNPSAYVKPITFAQIYIFPIDDNLRRWFLDFRNQDYDTISKDKTPKFPNPDKPEPKRILKVQLKNCPCKSLYNKKMDELLKISLPKKQRNDF